MTDFVIITDERGQVAYGLSNSDAMENCLIAANTETTVTVPEDVNIVVFGYVNGETVYTAKGDTPINLPTSGSFVATNAFPNRPLMDVTPGETIRFKSRTDADVTIAYYKKNPPGPRRAI